MRRFVVRVLRTLLPCVVLGAVGCRAGPKEDKARPVTLASSVVESGDAAPLTPAPKNSVAACAALDASAIAPYAVCGATVVKTPPPLIADPANALGPFYDRLAELERGAARRPLRIAVYGDSNLTSDFLSGHLRRVLQARYGDAGHGWVSLSKPWGSYRHEDVVHAGYWPMFKLYAPTTHIARDKQYGFANMAAESNEIGAAAWAATTKDAKAKVGQAVSRFELHYLKQPHGGSFAVQIDRKEVRSIDTRADAFEAGIDTFEVDEGPHELRCVVRGDGRVRLFGTSLDRTFPATPSADAGASATSADGAAPSATSADAGAPSATSATSAPGIQLDALGAGALNYERLTWVANDTRRVQLAKRGYDLVVMWLGTNVMFVPPNKAAATEFIGELRAALPGVPILILSPGDTARDGETKSDPRIIAVVKQMREVATDTGAAFWDFREAMGGDGSIIGFTKRGLTGEDHIHFGPEGSRFMGDRLLCALSTSFAGHVAAHPRAGCAPE